MHIRNSDGHTIYELESNKIINATNFGIHIGNHVWVGYDVIIIKDACIPYNCVIGAGALVGKGEFVDNSIIVGVPGKTIKTGVNWDSRSVSNFLKTQEGK